MSSEQVTSPSISEDERIPKATEMTSASEEENIPKASGRGRGHGRGRPSRGGPQTRGRGRHGAGRRNAKRQPEWLHTTNTMAAKDGEETSESEETARIKAADKRAKMWDHNEVSTSDSDADHAQEAACMESPSMPKTSGVFDYADWLVSTLSEEQRGKLTRAFSFMDLCAGLGTTLIAYEAIRRAMQKHGLPLDGECSGLTELAKDRREALGRRLTSLGLKARVLNSNADLTDRSSDAVFADIFGHRVRRYQPVLFNSEVANRPCWKYRDSLDGFHCLPRPVVARASAQGDRPRMCGQSWQQPQCPRANGERHQLGGRGPRGAWLRGAVDQDFGNAFWLATAPP